MSIVHYAKKGARRVSCKTSVEHQQLKAAGKRRTTAFVIGKLIVSLLPLIVVLVLLSCSQSNWNSQDSWSIYRNPRYSFEFPYPKHWIAFPMPDNLDGQVFRDPQNPNVVIRGWAANKLPETKAFSPQKPSNSPQTSQQHNFTTEQGLIGKLKVEVGSDFSLMTLSLSQENVLYSWQGQSESEQFADYYRFFNYVAHQYRISSPE